MGGWEGVDGIVVWSAQHLSPALVKPPFCSHFAPPCHQDVAEKPFATVTYTQAVQLLQNSGQKFDYPVEWGTDLQSEHERYLTEVLFDKTPLIVTDYPKDIKAFYMRLNEDGKTVAAMDVLVPGVGELIGGSQREERLEMLEQRMQECGLSPEDYWWCVCVCACGWGYACVGVRVGMELV